MSLAIGNPGGFKSGGPLVHRDRASHDELVFGMSIEEAAVMVVRRAIENGCTCTPTVQLGERGLALLHESGCPRLTDSRR